MDLGEEAVGGQGGEEPDHPLDDLHHLMIMPTKVPMGGVDNDNVGVEMEIPAPEPSLYQIPLLQMMSGTNLAREPEFPFQPQHYHYPPPQSVPLLA